MIIKTTWKAFVHAWPKLTTGRKVILVLLFPLEFASLMIIIRLKGVGHEPF